MRKLLAIAAIAALLTGCTTVIIAPRFDPCNVTLCRAWHHSWDWRQHEERRSAD